MLDEQRIKEAEKNIKQYLQDNILKKETFKQIVYDTYIRNHEESLILAQDIY